MRHSDQLQTDKDTDLTLIDLFAVLWQRRGIVMLVFVAVLMVAAALIPRLMPTYRSVAEIAFVIDREDAPINGGGVAQHLETAMTELRGNEVLATALSVLRGEGVQIVPAIEGSEGNEAGDNRVLGALRSRIEVVRIGNASVIEVSVTDHDAAQSQKILNAVIDSYLWQRESTRKQGLRARLMETSEQLLAANAKLAQAETDLSVWQQQAGFIEPDESRLMLDRIYQLNGMLEVARRDLERARLMADARKNAQSIDALLALPPIANNETVRRLSGQYDEVRRNHAALDQRYGPKHPAMIAVHRELETVQRHLRDAVLVAAEKIVLDLRDAQKQYDVIRSQRDDWQEKLTVRHEKAQGQAALLRAVELMRSEADTLGTTEQELRIALAAFQSDVTVMQAASLPETAEFPTRRDLWMAAVLVALFAAVVAGMLRHYFDQAIHDDGKLEDRFGIPLYARTPQVDAPFASAVSMEEAVGHLAVLINILAKTRVLAGRAHVSCIGSAVPGEGKSRLARDLATSFATAGMKTILLDGDLRHPAGFARVGNVSDLTAALAGEGTLEDAIQSWEDRESFDYIGARASVPGSFATGLLQNGLRDVLDHLGGRYDRIVIDSPPVLSVADAILLMGAADARLLVLRRGYSKRSDVRDAISQLNAAGLVPDGLVLAATRGRPAYGGDNADRAENA